MLTKQRTRELVAKLHDHRVAIRAIFALVEEHAIEVDDPALESAKRDLEAALDKIDSVNDSLLELLEERDQ